jgi:hypothetical protein
MLADLDGVRVSSGLISLIKPSFLGFIELDRAFLFTVILMRDRKTVLIPDNMDIGSKNIILLGDKPQRLCVK